jgi:hypothetical protein
METTIIKVNSACVCGVDSNYDVLYRNSDGTLFIARRKDYDNHGNFSGVPVMIVTADSHANVNPEKLFRMLGGNDSFTDKLTGIVDWETRLDWLSYFTDEEKRLAVLIENQLKELRWAA